MQQETITEAEYLALTLAREQVTSAQLRLELITQRITHAHKLENGDQLRGDGAIVRAPTPEPAPVPEPATDPAPEPVDTPAAAE